MNEFRLDTEYLQKIKKKFPELHAHLIKLKADVYIDGDSYCCTSGPNLKKERLAAEIHRKMHWLIGRRTT